MLRSAASKVMWVGRATVFLVGLAMILALVFGGASMAFAANGNNLILGSLKNAATAITKLTANADGPALQVQNNNAGTDDTALDLRVQAGEAPMSVNSAARVVNLNADKLDGLEASQLKGARAYALVEVTDSGSSPTFDTERTSGFDSVSRLAPGQYCLTAADYISNDYPAVVSVDWYNTAAPKSTASASYHAFGCGYGRFRVVTQRTVLSPGGELSDTFANDVSFVIAVP